MKFTQAKMEAIEKNYDNRLIKELQMLKDAIEEETGLVL